MFAALIALGAVMLGGAASRPPVLARAVGAWPAAATSLVKDPLPQADRAGLQAILKWPQECEQDHHAAVRALELPDARVRFFDLGGRRYLIEVGCARAAYQEVYRYFLLDESGPSVRARAFKLPTFTPDASGQWQSAELEEIAGETSFDVKRKLLTVMTRARGLGDCGTRALYSVDLKAGRLVLTDLWGRDCDGEPDKAPPPDQWPRVFPR
jgi:Protein of unknown function (DUF1176)